MCPFVPKLKLCQLDLFLVGHICARELAQRWKVVVYKKGAGCLCQLSKSGLFLFPQLSLFKTVKRHLCLCGIQWALPDQICHLMKGVQKLIRLKGFLARKEERPTAQGLGIQYFGDHSLYRTALFYNPISVPVKNILQDVKNISYIFCSVEDLFLNTRTTNLKL